MKKLGFIFFFGSMIIFSITSAFSQTAYSPDLVPEKITSFKLNTGFAVGDVTMGMPISIFTALFPKDISTEVTQFDLGLFVFVSFIDDNTELYFEFYRETEDDEPILVNVEIDAVNADSPIVFYADFLHPDKNVFAAFGTHVATLETTKFDNRKEEFYFYPSEEHPTALIVVQYAEKGTVLEKTRILSENSPTFINFKEYLAATKKEDITYEGFHSFNK